MFVVETLINHIGHINHSCFNSRSNLEDQIEVRVPKFEVQLGIYDYFQIVVSGDTLPVKKPDPLPLLHAAKFFKVEPNQALMIGDSISDVKAARAAGFQVVCVSYGYNHGEDIRDAHPDAVIDSMAQLSSLLTKAA